MFFIREDLLNISYMKDTLLGTLETHVSKRFSVFHTYLYVVA